MKLIQCSFAIFAYVFVFGYYLQLLHPLLMACALQHELRNPLHAITASVDVLKSEPLPPSASEYVDSILQSANAMMRLANDVLDLQRLQAGRMQVIIGPTDVRAILRDLVNQFKFMIPVRNLHGGGMRLWLSVAHVLNVPGVFRVVQYHSICILRPTRMHMRTRAFATCLRQQAVLLRAMCCICYFSANAV